MIDKLYCAVFSSLEIKVVGLPKNSWSMQITTAVKKLQLLHSSWNRFVYIWLKQFSIALCPYSQYICTVILFAHRVHWWVTKFNCQWQARQVYRYCNWKNWKIIVYGSLVVLEVWPCLWGSSRTPHECLGLGLVCRGLSFGLERKVLALAL